jgi:hypothetical protein
MSWFASISPLFLVVLVCPVVMSFLMFFMMRGIHSGGKHQQNDAGQADGDQRIAKLEDEVRELRSRQSRS